MRRPDEVVDPTGARQRRRRSAAFRVVLPFALVFSVIAAIGLIAVHSYQVNRNGALRLTRDLLRSTEEGVSEKVASYLAPAVRSAAVADDLLAHTGKEDRPVAFRAYAASTLRVVGSIEAFYLANARGEFAVIRRAPGGGTETHEQLIGPDGERSVVTEHRDAEGEVIDRKADPDDSFDPRTRRWYTGAVASAGRPFWSNPYLFRPTNRPVLTVSLARRDANGADHVVAVDVALDELSRFVDALRVGRNGEALIVDGDGHLVAAPALAKGGVDPSALSLDPRREPVMTQAWDRYRTIGAGAREIRQGPATYVTIAAALSTGAPGWVLLLAAPERDFASFTAVDGRQSLLFSLVIVALALLLAGLAVRSGLRADRLARRVEAQRTRSQEESLALAEITLRSGLLDPADDAPELTETLANLAGARRASLWRITSDGRMLACEDQYDRAGDGHVGGFALARDEMPHLFAALRAGEPFEVDDASRDGRTAEFHRLAMRDAATRALALHPIRQGDDTRGAVLIEDAAGLDRARNLARAIASIASLRFEARRRGEREDAIEALAPDAGSDRAEDDRASSRVASLLLPDEALSGAFGTDTAVYNAAAVLHLAFTDPPLGSRAAARGAVDAADDMARSVQEIGRRFDIPYLKIVGHSLVAACGLAEGANGGAAFRLAEAALALRNSCLDATERADLDAFFSIGIDVGRAVGRRLGDDPAVFNLWGEAIRGAELMAMTAADPGTIQVTEAAYAILRPRFLFRQRGRFFMPRAGVARCFVLAGTR